MALPIQGLIQEILLEHDWLRALRIASYGFLLYGPGSHVWYQFLDRCMPKQTFANLSAKVRFASSIALCVGYLTIYAVYTHTHIFSYKYCHFRLY
jgi:hypothetical protein